jgi:hypothetical protein
MLSNTGVEKPCNSHPKKDTENVEDRFKKRKYSPMRGKEVCLRYPGESHPIGSSPRR